MLSGCVIHNVQLDSYGSPIETLHPLRIFSIITKFINEHKSIDTINLIVSNPNQWWACLQNFANFSRQMHLDCARKMCGSFWGRRRDFEINEPLMVGSCKLSIRKYNLFKFKNWTKIHKRKPPKSGSHQFLSGLFTPQRDGLYRMQNVIEARTWKLCNHCYAASRSAVLRSLGGHLKASC